MQKKFDTIPEEVKRRCAQEIIALVEELTDKELGVIAAEQIVDAVTEHYGPEIYNIAINDAKKLVTEKLTDLEFELDSMQQQSHT